MAGTARQRRAVLGQARLARQARRVSVRFGAVRQGLAWCGTARQARTGVVWQGEEQRDKERLGKA